MGLLIEGEIPRRYLGLKDAKCVNCGGTIELRDRQGVYARIFCSTECKESYFQK